MKAVALHLLWLSLVVVPVAHAASPERLKLELSAGEQRVLPSTGVSSYSEGVPGVVDIRLTPDAAAFVVVGRRAGHTTLLFIMSDGHERVYDIDVRGAGAGNAEDTAGGAASSVVAARDNIRLDFYFVRVSRDYHHKIGVGWPSSVGGTFSSSFDVRAGSITDANALVSEQALPRLDMAQANGWAKLLRQAALVTANGSEAKLSGGGELNVPIEGGLSAGLKQIEFGTTVQVLPRYDHDSGRLELTIHADVSDLAGDGGTGVPGRVTSGLDSVVSLQLGQSVVLAGLRSQTASTSHSGLPFLSKLPILGGLFGSHESRREDFEELVFIVPSVVDEVSLHARAAIEDALRTFDAYAGDLDRAVFLKRGGAP